MFILIVPKYLFKKHFQAQTILNKITIKTEFIKEFYILLFLITFFLSDPHKTFPFLVDTTKMSKKEMEEIKGVDFINLIFDFQF